MKIEFASFRLTQLPEPFDSDDPVLQLFARLDSLEFDEHGLANLVETQAEQNQTLTVTLRRCLGDPSSVSIMVQLWLLSLKVDRQAVDNSLGLELTDRLIKWGLLVDLDNQIASTVDIHPCQDCWVATDHAIGQDRFMEAVYPLGGDSHILARLAPRKAAKLALDIATGSGIHAILAASHCEKVHAVDLSARALDFARFNACLNGVRQKLHFFQGDLFEPLPSSQYDLILTNLPWVPTPEEPSELYRSGGGDGEMLVRRVVEALPNRLRPLGWMAMYVEYPKFSFEGYLERVVKWLGDGAWGVVLLNIRHMTTSTYVMGQVATHTSQQLPDEYDRWMRSYEERGIEGMAWAMLYIRRLPARDVTWSVEREADFPSPNEKHWVADWLERLDQAHRLEPAKNSCPRLTPEARLWVRPDTQEAKIEWPDCCLKDVPLNRELGTLAAQLDGNTNWEDLSEQQESVRNLAKLGSVQF
jgi:SAM-dependent methyltransferase